MCRPDLNLTLLLVEPLSDEQQFNRDDDHSGQPYLTYHSCVEKSTYLCEGSHPNRRCGMEITLALSCT